MKSFSPQSKACIRKQAEQLLESHREEIVNSFTSLDKNSLLDELVMKTLELRLTRSDVESVMAETEKIHQMQIDSDLALFESEARFRAIFENNSAAIGVYEFDTTITMVNDAYCRILGCIREEVIGKSWTTQIPPDELKRLKEYNNIRVTNPTDAPIEYEFSFYHKSGEIKQALASIAMNMDLKKMIISFVDINDRKKAEKALKESQQMFETTFQYSPIPMALTKLSDGKYINVNTVFIQESGYAREEILGKTSLELGLFTNTADRKHIAEKVLEVGEISSFECDIRIKSGEVLPYIISSVRVLINGEAYLLSSLMGVKILKDAMKQLQQYSEELQELNATKDKFFSIIAHDLKSPFQGLMGYSKMLAEEYSDLDEDTRRVYIESILKISEEAYKLLENLLQWSRLQSGAMIFNPDVFNISQNLASTLSLLSENASRKSISFTKEIDKNAFVNADINMFTTIIRNLCSNAIKFTHSGGEVTINCFPFEEMLHIEVRDTGIGMDAERVSNLFRIDKDVSRNGTTGEQGTGLGLLLCKEMIERHSSKLEVESEVGKGTTFRFSVPLFRD